MAFQGFIKGVRYIPVPTPIFGELLEEIKDINELKIVLRIIRLIHDKKGLERCVTLNELLADRVLANSLDSSDIDSRETQILQALETAQNRNIFIKVEGQNKSTSLFYLNTEFERQAVGRISNLPSPSELEPWEPLGDRPNIYSLYEQNIGILTPMVAEKIGEAEQRYPLQWIEEAISEAVSLNSRNWRYISRILERWETEGKEDGKSRKHTSKARYI